MSVRNTLRALPALVRVGFASAVAYRAEMLIWVLSTTMPLVMLAFWNTVAREGPVGRFGGQEFTAYFLSAFIVRQIISVWVAWELNFEVRNGTLSMRLLRPVDPLISYAIENLSSIPMRIVVAVPVATIMLWTVGTRHLPDDWAIWVIWGVAMIGAWLVTFLIGLVIGSFSFLMESSLKLMDVYIVISMTLSGYLVPVEIFPDALRRVVDLLPFRYQLGLPIELMTSAHGREAALTLLARQWLYVAGLFFVVRALWRHGLKRFAAYGG